MADERLRELARDAANGEPEAQRRYMSYAIGKLEIELPLQPTLLSKMGRGKYDGQEVFQKNGKAHPCVRWLTIDNNQELWDLVDGVKIHERSLYYSSNQMMVIPTSLAPVLQRFTDTGENGGGPGLGDIEMIENPFMDEDQILVVQREPTIGQLYPARFPTFTETGEADEAGDQTR